MYKRGDEKRYCIACNAIVIKNSQTWCRDCKRLHNVAAFAAFKAYQARKRAASRKVERV